MRRLTGGILASAAAAAAAVALGAGTARASAPAQTVTVRPAHTLQRLSSAATGADMPFWNGNLTRPVSVRRLRQAHLRMLDFDAGWPIDLYDFQTNRLFPDPDAARDAKLGEVASKLRPLFTFNQFESVARAAGVQTTVHVNYGTGTPALAAAWVRDANLVHHDHIRDWIIGEEVYLDQFNEPNSRVPTTGGLQSPVADAQDYATNLQAYAAAMKAVDPSIKVGVEAFPVPLLGKHAGGEAEYLSAWDRALISTPGLTRSIDFLDIHWLGDPAARTIAGQLRSIAEIGPAVANLRHQLDAQPDGRHVQIIAGEVNSAIAPAPYSETQGNAAYLADSELSLLAHGVTSAQWFALYSSPGESSPRDDIGLLSSHRCPHGRCEPAVGTPFPTFEAQELVGAATRPGARLVATSAAGAVVADALREPGGALDVMLVNTAATPTSARIRVPGRHLPATAVERQAAGHGIATRTVRATGRLTLPGDAVTLVTLR